MKVSSLYCLYGLFSIVMGGVFMITGDKALSFYLGTVGMLYLIWSDIRTLLDR